MAILSDSILYDLVVAMIFLIICLYLFFTSTFNYWKDRGVPYIKPIPFFGNVKEQFLAFRSVCYIYQDFYDAMEGERYAGLYEIKKPILLIRDPELVEKIMIKDFEHFYNRGFPADFEREPLSANLFNLENMTWRNLRYKLTPTFSTGKLKGMFEQIHNCGEGLVRCIEKESKIDNAVEGKQLISNFTFDVIASVAFGLQLDEDSEENKNFRRIVATLFVPDKLQILRFLIISYLPNFARRVGIKQFPQEVEDITMQLVTSTLNYRRQNNVKRNDFLQLLLNLQKQEKDGTLNFQKDLDHHPEDDVIDQMEHVSEGIEDRLEDIQKDFMTDSVIAAQSLIFFTAGSESTSSTINLALYSLTLNPKIQKKVHDELDSVLANYNNKWSYQAVKEMDYLEQVIQETLRMYPVAPILFRECTQAYKVPDSTLVIEEGVRVAIPVMAIHNDPKYHEKPELFNPDRFQDNNFKPNGTFLPFGNGPRVCIAMRFAVLEVKMVLARILAQYKVKLSPKTQLPLTFSKKSFLLTPENSFFFEFDKRQIK